MASAEIKSLLESANPWWSSKETFPSVPEYERKNLSDVLDIQSGRAVVLVGPRQSGKTTLMLQAIKHLLQRTEPVNLVYAPLDQMKGATVKDVISAHRELTGAGAGCYYFFDEVHHDKMWSIALKTLVDSKTSDRYCATGSSSTLLLKNVSESGLGRFDFKPTSPFSFGEFAEVGGRKTSLRLDLNSPDGALENGLKLASEMRELEPLFHKYLLWGGFPGQFSSSYDVHSWHNSLRQNYVSLTIYKDILSHYEIRNPAVLEDLLYMVSEKTSLPISYESIAESFRLNINTARSYLSYLESAGLVISCEYHTTNTLKRARRNKKFYVLDPGFNTALARSTTLSDELAGKNVETAVAACLLNALKRETGLLNPHLEYWKEKYEVDFVVKIGGEAIPIEVKYANDVGESDLRGLRDFMDAHKARRGIVVTKNIAERRKMENKPISMIPARVLLAGMG